MAKILAALAVLLLALHAAHADDTTAAAEASNMQIIGHSDLNGSGKGGEGLAIKQYPDGRRVLTSRMNPPRCASA